MSNSTTITMSFAGHATGSVSVAIDGPTRADFKALASALYGTYASAVQMADDAGLGIRPDRTLRLPPWQSGGVGNKIAAIKAVRELTGLSLKEAKDVVEQGGDIVLPPGVSHEQARDALLVTGARPE